jgi:hypothetical protein
MTYSVQVLVNGVQIISPTPDETINMSTVHIVVHASEPVAVSQVRGWDNGTKLGRCPGIDLNGSHTVTVVDLDKSYSAIHRSSVSYSVQ